MMKVGVLLQIPQISLMVVVASGGRLSDEYSLFFLPEYICNTETYKEELLPGYETALTLPLHDSHQQTDQQREGSSVCDVTAST